MKNILVIGNGPIDVDIRRVVNEAEIVVRFNRPRQDIARVGTRADIIYVVNAPKFLKSLISDSNLFDLPPFSNSPRVIFPYSAEVVKNYHAPGILHRLTAARFDLTEEAAGVFEKRGIVVNVLKSEVYHRCCEALEIDEKRKRISFPSTGFIAIYDLLSKHQAGELKLSLCGFSWTGWKRHPWSAERRWIRAQKDVRLIA